MKGSEATSQNPLWRMSKRDYRKGSIPYPFVPVPKDVLRSSMYHALPASAKALTFDLALQYTGKNNGRLCPGFEVMQRIGWTSKHTLMRAKRALMDCKFAMQTRIGHPPRTAEWIGFTWWKLDYHESMEIQTPQLALPQLRDGTFRSAETALVARERSPWWCRTAPMKRQTRPAISAETAPRHRGKARNRPWCQNSTSSRVAISVLLIRLLLLHLQQLNLLFYLSLIAARQTRLGLLLGDRIRVLSGAANRVQYALARKRMAGQSSTDSSC